jgi:hypothetical protein
MCMACPNCGAEMEPIDSGSEGLVLSELRLCPMCYLVAWTDENGLQMRQGVPVTPSSGPREETVN